jgi:hypothetical protein
MQSQNDGLGARFGNRRDHPQLLDGFIIETSNLLAEKHDADLARDYLPDEGCGIHIVSFDEGIG